MRRLNRRTMLRGAGGALIALPFLEAMGGGRAEAASFPKRFVTFFTPNGNLPQGEGEGSTFTLAPHLSALEPFRDDLLLMTGFNNQVGIRSAGDNHQRGIGCLLTAATLSEEPLFCEALCEEGNRTYVGWSQGPSLDQVLARTPGIGDQTRFPSLELGVGVQLSTVYARLCYAGASQPITPEDDPQAAFSRLFGNVTPALRARRRSVIDAVLPDYGALGRRLGGEDRARLDRHVTALREVERDLDRAELAPAPTCEVRPIARPPSLYADVDYPAVGKAQMDLVAMALACDLTRVVTLQWDTSISNLVFSWLPGMIEGHHELSHHSKEDAPAQALLASIEGWYAAQLAYLMAALDAIPEGDGTVLDNTVILWANELSNGYRHTLHDMHWMLAGGCGGFFDTGRLVRYLGHPHGNLLVSIANAMGAPITTFGDPEHCTGAMPGLTGSM